MASILSQSSREQTLNGFPADLPANSGLHEAKFFIGAPNGVKHVKEFPNEMPDGTVKVNRVVSYSMLVDAVDHNGRSRTYCCFLNIRKSDYTKAGRYGDRSVENLLDTLLEEASDTGVNHVVDIKAATDRTDDQGNIIKAKNGQANLA
tara:strand:- start:175 stop:618 length:444 start_codon:yes stop_codon:yes gene_type:complete